MTAPAPKALKQQLRQRMRTQLSELTEDQRQSASAEICRKIAEWLQQHPEVRTIASFLGMASEPDLSRLHTLCPDRCFCYPRSHADGSMDFHKVSELNTLETGLYGIRQPRLDANTLVATDTIDLFLCPAFAFTKDGQRLGKGGGYYDRALSQRAPHSKLLGICFHLQVLAELPTEPHDIRVDRVIDDSPAL